MKTLGPNMKKLIAHKMSLDAIPPGGGVASGVEFLMNTDRIRESAKRATEWAQLAVQAIRQAGEPNEWKPAEDEEDEAIAGELLRMIDERKKK